MYLSTSAVGTYVVRFGNNSTYRMTVKTSDKTDDGFTTIFIRHLFNKSEYSVKHFDALKGKIFASLEDLVEAVQTVLGIPLTPPKTSHFLMLAK